VAAGLLALALAGCSSPPPRAVPGPVDVPAPAAVTAADAARCAALVAALPGTLGQGRELPRRATSGSTGRTAAWGDPAVTLVCGTPPADPTAEQVQLGPSSG
jgi:hypothetical protein